MRKISKLKEKPRLFINNLPEKFSNVNSSFPKIGILLNSQTYGKLKPKKIIFNKNDIEKQYYNFNGYKLQRKEMNFPMMEEKQKKRELFLEELIKKKSRRVSYRAKGRS